MTRAEIHQLSLENAARLWKMKESGLTLAEIGKREGVTRERVRQILRKIGTDYRRVEQLKSLFFCMDCGVLVAKGPRCYPCSGKYRRKYQDAICAWCGARFYRHSMTKTAKSERAFCNRDHLHQWQRDNRTLLSELIKTAKASKTL